MMYAKNYVKYMNYMRYKLSFDSLLYDKDPVKTRCQDRCSGFVQEYWE